MPAAADEVRPRRSRRPDRPEAGWAGRKNGELPALAAADFDVFVTIDQDLQYEQSLSESGVAVIVLECRSNRYDDLLPLVPKLLEVLRDRPAPGELRRVGV